MAPDVVSAPTSDAVPDFVQMFENISECTVKNSRILLEMYPGREPEVIEIEEGKGRKGGKRKRTKETAAQAEPKKKRQTGYLMFSSQERPKLPDGLDPRAKMTAIADLWKQLSDEEKEAWKSMATEANNAAEPLEAGEMQVETVQAPAPAPAPAAGASSSSSGPGVKEKQKKKQKKDEAAPETPAPLTPAPVASPALAPVPTPAPSEEDIAAKKRRKAEKKAKKEAAAAAAAAAAAVAQSATPSVEGEKKKKKKKNKEAAAVVN